MFCLLSYFNEEIIEVVVLEDGENQLKDKDFFLLIEIDKKIIKIWGKARNSAGEVVTNTRYIHEYIDESTLHKPNSPEFYQVEAEEGIAIIIMPGAMDGSFFSLEWRKKLPIGLTHKQLVDYILVER